MNNAQLYHWIKQNADILLPYEGSEHLRITQFNDKCIKVCLLNPHTQDRSEIFYVGKKDGKLTNMLHQNQVKTPSYVQNGIIDRLVLDGHDMTQLTDITVVRFLAPSPLIQILSSWVTVKVQDCKKKLDTAMFNVGSGKTADDRLKTMQIVKDHAVKLTHWTTIKASLAILCQESDENAVQGLISVLVRILEDRDATEIDSEKKAATAVLKSTSAKLINKVGVNDNRLNCIFRSVVYPS